ncbi:P-loop containing nucleoside triphosphate hydrolase protein [Russula dissimulans]|nr:P-loop containing nucleoside triphosphate hydrolase protein [Russula dissimulans]
MHPIPKHDSVILQSARTEATKNRGYSSEETRSEISSAFKDSFNGLEPYSRQLDVCEALLLGLDCIVIAGNGAGKTTPFIMPLLAYPTKKKVVIIISPSRLNVLERDQAMRFNKIGLRATTVNRYVWNPELEEAISKLDYRVLLTSPEMCLEHSSFSKLMRSTHFTKNVLAIVIDEAHCVSPWANPDESRKHFGELGRLRSFVPTSVPFLAMSATLPPHVLSDVTYRLGFWANDTLLVNLGNHRANVTMILIKMASAKDLRALDFLVDEALSGGSLVRTVVFFNSCDMTQKGSMYLQGLLPEDRRHEVDFLHAFREARAQCKILTEFRRGVVNILCATQAAGMGMDIPDIERVVQFSVPTSLSVLNQCAGRAGRSGQHALAILLAEPSGFQTSDAIIKAEPNEDSDEDLDLATFQACFLGDDEAQVEYKMEPGVQAWCLAEGCRVEVLDQYFNNPSRSSGPSVHPCCDNCILIRRAAPDAILTDAERNVLSLLDRIQTEPSSIFDTSQEVIDVDGLDTLTEDNISPARRRGEHLKRPYFQRQTSPNLPQIFLYRASKT